MRFSEGTGHRRTGPRHQVAQRIIGKARRIVARAGLAQRVTEGIEGLGEVAVHNGRGIGRQRIGPAVEGAVAPVPLFPTLIGSFLCYLFRYRCATTMASPILSETAKMRLSEWTILPCHSDFTSVWIVRLSIALNCISLMLPIIRH